MLPTTHLGEGEGLSGILRASVPALARLTHRDLLGRLLADSIALCADGIALLGDSITLCVVGTALEVLSGEATGSLQLVSLVALALGTGLSTAAQAGADLDEAVVRALEPRIRGGGGLGAHRHCTVTLRGTVRLHRRGLRGGLPPQGGGPGVRGRLVGPGGWERPTLRGAHFDPLRDIRARSILSRGRRTLGGRRSGAGLVVGRRVQRRHGNPG